MRPIVAALLALLLAAVAVAAPARAQAPAQVTAVDMIGFTVSDMDRSVEFYSKVLTFEKVMDKEVLGPPYETLTGVFATRLRIVHMKLGDQTLELTQFIAPPDSRPIPVPSHSNDVWFQHMAIVVSDMDRAYDVLRRHGVQQISPGPQTIPPSNVPAAGIKAIKFRDPDNHNLELLAFPADKGDALWHKTTDRLFLGLDHSAMTISNTEKSLAFYRDLLGMKIVGGSLNTGITQEWLDGLAGARVRVTPVAPAQGTPHVEFLQYEAPGPGRNMPADTRANDIWHWQLSFVVRDVDAAAKALTNAGVTAMSTAPTTVPDAGLGFRKAYMVLDPDGHAVRLIEK